MPCIWNESNFNPFMNIDWRGRQKRLGDVIRTWVCLTEAARGRSEHASWLSYFFIFSYFPVVLTLFIYSVVFFRFCEFCFFAICGLYVCLCLFANH